MDYDAIKFWWIVSVQLIEGVILVIIWLGNKQRASRKEIQGAIDSLRSDISNNEVPTANALNRLEEHLNVKLDLLREQVGRERERLSVVKKTLDGAPSHADLTALNREVSNLATAIGEIRGAMQGVTNLTQLMNQFLMEQKGG